jgi:nucleotide-binding universal stress UspA family protein
MMKFKKILVPLDGSKLAERAAAPALVLAEAMSAKVTFLRVAIPLSLNLDPDFYQRIIDIRTDEAERYLQKAQYRCSSPPVEIELDTVVGSPARSIINYVQENEIDLIVMSNHGRSGIGRWRYGSVAERVLRRAPCATIVMRAQVEVAPFAHKTILGPLDGSPLAEQALEPAIAVARAVAAELTLLRVTSPAQRGSYEATSPGIKTKKWLHKIGGIARMEAITYLKSVQTTLSHHHIPIKVVVETGDDVAETIIDQAERLQVDSIIMSRHGRSALSRWVFGSVTEKVMRGAHCATIAIRGQEISKRKMLAIYKVRDYLRLRFGNYQRGTA